MLPDENCDVRAMVVDEFAKHKHTIDAKNLRVSIDGADIRFRTARPMLRVVLSNLIQNAVRYSEQSIHVAISPDCVAVSNSFAATGEQVSEDGLGLEIVQRVCDRMGWGFSAQPHGKEFLAQVAFRSID